jgi:hypothetical protein
MTRGVHFGIPLLPLSTCSRRRFNWPRHLCRLMMPWPARRCLPQSISAVVSTLCRSASVVLSTASLRGTSCLTLVLIYPGRSALLVMPVHVAITHLPSLAHFVVSSVMIHSVSILPVSVVLTHPAESAFFLGDTVMGYIEHIT